ncbi:MAG: acyl-ACP--UDP-N-acetylglucosamine O-acyltransferase [Methylococcaceae bacterium]|nr:MAG: acyl-ACP--UDP-N-acetylglucosamine O-acyltransferase [Methylococcaceae bacterium]
MSALIHPTACISEACHLGKNVKIGPFVVIEPNAHIGDHCIIDAHSVIHSHVIMGANNRLHPHVVLGGLPQDTRFKEDTPSLLRIGEGNVFREGFTAHRAATENAVTLIGSQCYFMNNSHVAHDCSIGDATIFANNVAIGGFVEIGDHVFMGGGAVVHQFCRIGAFAMVRGNSGLSMDALPYMLIGGSPGRHYKLNTVGLKRAGITGEKYKILTQALRLLRVKQSLDILPQTDEIKYLNLWMTMKSKRGIHGFIDTTV